jgi:hypothetical protein
MPYQLCIWDPERHSPMPTTADEAVDAMERLTKVEDNWDLKLSPFVDGLVRRYHDDPQVAKDAGGFEAFWGSDPRQSASICHSAVFRLSMPPEPCVRQISYAIGAAAELGLVLVDDENGMCFLPDGSVLPEDMREMWESELQEMKAGPADPSVKKPEGRTFLAQLGGALFDALGDDE